MRKSLLALAFVAATGLSAAAGEAEISAAQGVVESQLRAFQAGDDALAYSFAAPSIKQIFPTVESFMSMVANGYRPVHHPQNFSFGKSEEMGETVVQQVLLVGPDGKDYEAVYTLQRQPDGSYLITGCSLRAANTLST